MAFGHFVLGSHNFMVAALGSCVKWPISVHEYHLPLVCSKISSSCILKYKHVTLAISTLKNIFPLHTKAQDYHLMYPSALLEMS